MVIGRIGSTENGKTVVYDMNTEEIVSIAIPLFPKGTEIYQDNNGNWRANIENIEEINKNKLKQAEDFYYVTKDFLSYDDYSYIVNKFPTECYTLWKKNPYYLCDIKRANGESSVSTIDKIDPYIIISTFEERKREIHYVMKHILDLNEKQGNSWMPYKVFEKKAINLLKKCGHMLQRGSILPYLVYYSEEDIYFEKGMVANKYTYRNERCIYRQVKYASMLPAPFSRYEARYDKNLSEEQNNAVKNLILKGGHISILTGGPGTGKTTILKKIVFNMLDQYPEINIHMLSPTGRAARRIGEVFGNMDMNISTIHKFLGYGHQLSKAELQRIQESDIIIIDESSMLDIEIFGRLLKYANIDRTKIIVVGDVDQLPSIGAGNILSDLINLGVYTERLTENFRSKGSIVKNARKINKGNFLLEEGNDFKIITDPVYMTDYLSALKEEEDSVVVTPYRVAENKKGDELLGASSRVNKIVQTKFYGRKMPEKYNIGDIVIMTKTNYHIGYFNGEIGKICGKVWGEEYNIDFGDRILTIRDEEDMDLGYAFTVYKSQGSEYTKVIITIPKYSDFVTRRMLYTAVTRAKEYVEIHTTKEILRKIILNNKEEKRYTFLSYFPKLV